MKRIWQKIRNNPRESREWAKVIFEGFKLLSIIGAALALWFTYKDYSADRKREAKERFTEIVSMLNQANNPVIHTDAIGEMEAFLKEKTGSEEEKYSEQVIRTLVRYLGTRSDRLSWELNRNSIISLCAKEKDMVATENFAKVNRTLFVSPEEILESLPPGGEEEKPEEVKERGLEITASAIWGIIREKGRLSGVTREKGIKRYQILEGNELCLNTSIIHFILALKVVLL